MMTASFISQQCFHKVNFLHQRCVQSSLQHKRERRMQLNEATYALKVVIAPIQQHERPATLLPVYIGLPTIPV